jgi:hypothetical protein
VVQPAKGGAGMIGSNLKPTYPRAGQVRRDPHPGVGDKPGRPMGACSAGAAAHASEQQAHGWHGTAAGQQARARGTTSPSAPGTATMLRSSPPSSLQCPAPPPRRAPPTLARADPGARAPETRGRGAPRGRGPPISCFSGGEKKRKKLRARRKGTRWVADRWVPEM